MRKMVDTTKVVFMAALLGLVLAGCNRGASDKGASTTPSTSTSGTTGAASGTASTSPGASSGSSSSAGSVIDDSIITTKVKTALLADADVKGTDINVETKQGEVMLSGIVNNKAQVDKAIQVASAIEGVKKVTDKTAVKP